MHDHALYMRTLSEFTRILLVPYDVDIALHELTDRVTGVLGIPGSGVCLGRGGRLVAHSSSGDKIAEIEKVQEQEQAGPCVEAYTSGEVVVVDDLSVEPERWPAYARMAQECGLHSAAAIPMRLDDRSVGSLNLYGDSPRPWAGEDLIAARVMADMATGYLINASQHRKERELSAQLQHALDGRLIVEQAKGMLAARRNVSPEAAFQVIRAHARSRSATVREIADAVVRLGLDLR